MSARGFIGAGDLYVARYNASTGALDALQGPYEVRRFEIKPNVEIKEMTSKGRNTYGQVIESVPLAQPSEFSVDFGEVNRESLTLALLGTPTAINRAGGTIDAGDAIEITMTDGWTELPHQNWQSTGFTVRNEAGSETYELDTDYEVNWRMGWIRIKPQSDINVGDKVQVHGTYNAISGSSIAGSTNTQLRAKFILDGVNFADQLPCIVTVHEAVMSPESGFDFLSDDFAEVPLTGRMKTPVGKAEPFLVELRDTAS